MIRRWTYSFLPSHSTRLLGPAVMAALILASGCGWELAESQKLICGDGKKAIEEECDGADLGGTHCKALGFEGGDLACTNKCTLDRDRCHTCGDGKKGKGEPCDGSILGGKACKDFTGSGGGAFEGGSLACKADCSGVDTSGCYLCGDGKITGADICDGADLGGKACKDLGYEGGTLTCKADCSWFDTSKCYRCGDNKITGTDTCDGIDLGNKKCADFAYEGGTLACKKDCTYDTSACYKCGDNKITGTDICDGPDLGKKTCADLSFQGGTLACSKDCKTFNTAGCYKCGDNKINGTDVCDGALLAGKTCKALGWEGGTLACKTDCSWFDETACYRCGDKKKNGIEQCDGADLGGAGCSAVGMVSGVLTCKKDCTFDASGCFPTEWKWARQGGSTGRDVGKRIAVDSAGNVYVAGDITTSGTFGSKALTFTNAANVFLTKVDSAGSFLWALGSDGPGTAMVTGLAVDSSGNAYVTGDCGTSQGGVCGSTLTFGSTVLPGNARWFAKASPAGKWEWAINIGSPQVIDMAMDSAGNIYITGRCHGTVTLGSHQMACVNSVTGTPNTVGYAAKLNNKGACQWATAFPTGSYSAAESLAVASDGSVYVAGWFSGPMTIGGDVLLPLGFSSYNNFYLAKLDKSGTPLWGRAGDIKNHPQSLSNTHGLGLDGKGNVYLFGDYIGMMEFGSITLTASPTYGPYRPFDIFLAKISPAGTWAWAVGGGGNYYYRAQDLAVDSAGNSYITAVFNSVVTMGGFSKLGYGDDGLVAKVDAAGKVAWVVTAGGPGADGLYSIAQDGKGHVYVTGGCSDWATFGQHSLAVTPYYNTDMCVARLKVAP